jgi:hypothetical protein
MHHVGNDKQGKRKQIKPKRFVLRLGHRKIGNPPTKKYLGLL